MKWIGKSQAMNIYHYVYVLLILAVLLGICKSKGAVRGVFAAIILVICLFSFLDYSLLYYRGLGFMKSDFAKGSSLILCLKHMGLPKGIKAYACLMWGLLLVIAANVYNRIAVINKIKIFKVNIVAVAMFAGTILLGLVTDYPNNICLFRGEKLFPKLEYSGKEEWWERDSVICHALGTTAEGDTLTNSYNALEYNYARGFRTFETDISFTSEGIPVLRHDWGSDLGQADAFGWTDDKKEVPSLELFLSNPIYGKYTPMRLSDLFEYMDRHRDVYVVFDMKIISELSEAEQYAKIVETAKNAGCEDVLNRCAVQLYYMDMYEEIEEVYHFDNYLLTLYMIEEPDHEELGNYLMNNDIPVLTVPYYYDMPVITEDMKKYGIIVYTHTIDDVGEAWSNIARGIEGIYTDTITPAVAEGIKNNRLKVNNESN